jgi:hypothetical protein
MQPKERQCFKRTQPSDPLPDLLAGLYRSNKRMCNISVASALDGSYPICVLPAFVGENDPRRHVLFGRMIDHHDRELFRQAGWLEDPNCAGFVRKWYASPSHYSCGYRNLESLRYLSNRPSGRVEDEIRYVSPDALSKSIVNQVLGTPRSPGLGSRLDCRLPVSYSSVNRIAAEGALRTG